MSGATGTHRWADIVRSGAAAGRPATSCATSCIVYNPPRGPPSLFRQALCVPSPPAACCARFPPPRSAPCSAANRIRSRPAILIPPPPSSFRGQSRLRTFFPLARPLFLGRPSLSRCGRPHSAAGCVRSLPGSPLRPAVLVSP